MTSRGLILRFFHIDFQGNRVEKKAIPQLSLCTLFLQNKPMEIRKPYITYLPFSNFSRVNIQKTTTLILPMNGKTHWNDKILYNILTMSGDDFRFSHIRYRNHHSFIRVHCRCTCIKGGAFNRVACTVTEKRNIATFHLATLL